MSVILVVEDDPGNKDLVTRFLKRCGHKVMLAADGMVAVATAAEHVPDLILMDLSLPGMDGWEAAGLIKSKPETAHVPIIALTAHKSSGDINKAVGAGIDAYEIKPLVYQRLMKKIAALCERG